MPAPARVPVPFATDEDIAVRAADDYLVLCPDWQELAGGTDGTFAPGDRWTLASATTDFAGQGIKSNCVVHLAKPASIFRGSGKLFAVDSVTANTATLRRLGQPAGTGAPPVPAGGATGVEFRVPTFGPQIDLASWELMRRYGIGKPGEWAWPHETANLYDVRDLQQLCVLTVLYDRYASANRGKEGDFATKVAQVKSDLDDLEARVTVRWGPGGIGEQATGPFGRRLMR